MFVPSSSFVSCRLLGWHFEYGRGLTGIKCRKSCASTSPARRQLHAEARRIHEHHLPVFPREESPWWLAFPPPRDKVIDRKRSIGRCKCRAFGYALLFSQSFFNLPASRL